MKNQINNIFIALLVLLPCASIAQGNAPMWLDGDVRNMQYSQENYYSGFAQVALAQGEIQEKALSRAKHNAIGELSDRVRVSVNSNKTQVSVSTGGSNIEEQIRSKFSSVINTTSQADVTGSKAETYFDAATRTAYAFAYVSKTQMSDYYQQQISFHLGKVEGALQTASDLAAKGHKAKARTQCESVIESFAKIAYAQDLLTAINPQANMQQSKSESLRNTLIQTIADLENSTYIYIECNETVNGQTVVHIGDRLPGLLTEKGCDCNFTDMQEEADYIIKIDALLTRCNNAADNIVFCYANATVNIYNTRTKKTLMPKISETKGGWTGGNRARATEEAFNELADGIVEKVLPIIKN